MAVADLSRAQVALRLTPERAVRAAAAVGGAVTLWNALAYPWGAGYDSNAHRTYVDFLLAHHTLPDRSGSWEYYSPPLYYIVAALATWIGRHGGLGDPYKLVQLLNVPAVVGTILLVAAFSRVLWPRMRWAAPAAAGFVALLPVLQRTAAMLHPEPLDLLLCTAGAYLAARILVERRYGLRLALAAGLALGAAQMVRQFALYTLGAVVVAWLVALGRRVEDRRSLARAGAVALVACVVVAGPWYGYRVHRYGNALFDRKPTSSKPLLERRPASFYVDGGLPDLLSRPYRPHMRNLAWPQTYADIWGDWYGAFSWRYAPGTPPSQGQRAWLVLQNVVGFVPTLLALGGWLVLLALGLRRRDGPLLLVALVPLGGLLGYLYFAVSNPTVDGDVLKPTFMLSTLWAWALCFGWAVARIGPRAPRLAWWTLAALAVLDGAFVVYRGALGFF